MKPCVWSLTASGHNRLSESVFFWGGVLISHACWDFACVTASHGHICSPGAPFTCLSGSFSAQMVGLGDFVLGNVLVSWRVSLDFDLIPVTV